MSNQKKSGFTPVKNGLLEGCHRKKMGEAIWLFLKYCQFAGKYIYKNTDEICILIYPKSIQKSLDITDATWFDWHQLLEAEGYISSKFLVDKQAYTVCIKKPIVFKNNI